MSSIVAFSCPAAFYEIFERKVGDQWSTHYCPGCGHGIVHKLVAEAIDDLDLADRLILLNPSGCAALAHHYLDVAHVQVPGGGGPAVATGIKRARPDSLVVDYQGDGDLAGAGLNEVVHAAARGENITVLLVNNGVYGSTGGQMAPTAPLGAVTATTPGGRHPREQGYPLRVCELLATLEAPYYLERVAIGNSSHTAAARSAIRKALCYQSENRGFSLVEILSPCPAGWSLPPVDAARLTLEGLASVHPPGLFRDGHDLDLDHPRRRVDPGSEEILRRLGIDDAAPARTVSGSRRPIRDSRIKISGFGAQGVVLCGRALAQAGMLEGRQVACLASYGPEARGGTAQSHVTLSDREVDSPWIDVPTTLLAMNRPSLERFGADVADGGTILYNSSVIRDPSRREGARMLPVPADEVAEGAGSPELAGVVMLGAVVGLSAAVSKDAASVALETLFAGDERLLERCRRAVDEGAAAVAGERPAPPDDRT